MTDVSGFPFPFDLGAVARDMQQRFGWTEGDLQAAMSQLMPAAMSGFRHFGPAVPAFQPFLAGFKTPMDVASFLMPESAAPGEETLMPFFGPKFVQKAVSEQIASATGLQQEAIAEMMPVAATLAMGQVARPYLQGEARELLDAFLRGYARGRPKPVPGPADYIQGYTEAMQAFWSGFLKPSASPPEQPVEPEDAYDEVDEPDPEDDEPVGSEAPASENEFETMMADWMTAGRDFQSSQFKAFDSFFERAVRDLDEGSAQSS
ncbi:DUF937 domain-containing protein [Roseibium sp.]|uniref:DUF937 domain-containing protein n=1 Tax=Roseibium sp. TaxID=1936156 RepID=UPI003A97FD0A